MEKCETGAAPHRAAGRGCRPARAILEAHLGPGRQRRRGAVLEERGSEGGSRKLQRRLAGKLTRDSRRTDVYERSTGVAFVQAPPGRVVARNKAAIKLVQEEGTLTGRRRSWPTFSKRREFRADPSLPIQGCTHRTNVRKTNWTEGIKGAAESARDTAGESRARWGLGESSGVEGGSEGPRGTSRPAGTSLREARTERGRVRIAGGERRDFRTDAAHPRAARWGPKGARTRHPGGGHSRRRFESGWSLTWLGENSARPAERRDALHLLGDPSGTARSRAPHPALRGQDGRRRSTGSTLDARRRSASTCTAAHAIPLGGTDSREDDAELLPNTRARAPRESAPLPEPTAALSYLGLTIPPASGTSHAAATRGKQKNNAGETSKLISFAHRPSSEASFSRDALESIHANRRSKAGSAAGRAAG
ncbi:hypothetical protein KM043_003792 [Ampulex compressa]|nr:hypothetical protein KM043_003792 [Ampulex compressa]